MSALLIPIGSTVCLNKLSKFTGFAKSVVGLEPRPCDTEALTFDRNTAVESAPMRIGRADHPGKSDRKLAFNRHMAFVIDFTEFTSETLKTPGHIANPVSLIFLYIRVGLMRLNTLPEFIA